MEMLFSAQFWVSLLQIIGVNIVLSGDNAVVIALAARELPPRQQRKAIVFGSAAAIAMRVILTVFAVEMLKLPWLKLIGAALLLWIGIRLLVPEGDGEAGVESRDTLLAAIKTILVADLVMSLDNVIGVAAAARGNVPLLVIGLAISIPLIIYGSTLILRLMERFPVIVTLGAALLGFVAGEMAATDLAIGAWVEPHASWMEAGAGAAGAAIVVLSGKWLASRTRPGEHTVV